MSEYKNNELESDTDSENNSIPPEENNQNNNNMNKLFNQSRQNFEKFSKMAKTNNFNNKSYSDKSLSKDQYQEEDVQEEYDDPNNSMDNYSNREVNNFDKRKKLTVENKRKNPLQTEKDDYESYSDQEGENRGVQNDISEEEIEDFQKNNYQINDPKENQKLEFFNIEEFYDLDVDDEAKMLLSDMKNFTPNRDLLYLDTKLKPFIPNYIPSIGEVDAFIKINRPDNNIEDMGLDYIDEPSIKGIDPSIFSLELAYKLKSKIPESYVIKNIEEAHKNPKLIQNWIDNLENLHKEALSSNIDYSNKMPDLESLMQV